MKWRTVEDEIEGVARYVQDAVRCSAGELAESRVCVAVPDQRWGRLAQKALEYRRLTVSRTQLGYALGGNPRVAERCGVPAAFNRLALLAHPDDAFALHVWCGLGRPDLGARAWVDATACGEGRDGRPQSFCRGSGRLRRRAVYPHPRNPRLC